MSCPGPKAAHRSQKRLEEGSGARGAAVPDRRAAMRGRAGERQHQRASALSWSSTPFVKALSRTGDGQM